MLLVARSGRESPLKSPTAIERGYEPAGKVVGPAKPPFPSPSSSEMASRPIPSFATARSGRESPLKTPMAIDPGYRPAGKVVGPPKPPPPLPSNNETLPPSFATARSGFASASKSPRAIDVGLSPTMKSVFGAKVPLPLPSSSAKTLKFWFATARSGLKSPLKSPTATDALSLRNGPWRS